MLNEKGDFTLVIGWLEVDMASDEMGAIWASVVFETFIDLYIREKAQMWDIWKALFIKKFSFR